MDIKHAHGHAKSRLNIDSIKIIFQPFHISFTLFTHEIKIIPACTSSRIKSLSMTMIIYLKPFEPFLYLIIWLIKEMKLKWESSVHLQVFSGYFKRFFEQMPSK